MVQAMASKSRSANNRHTWKARNTKTGKRKMAVGLPDQETSLGISDEAREVDGYSWNVNSSDR